MLYGDISLFRYGSMEWSPTNPLARITPISPPLSLPLNVPHNPPSALPQPFLNRIPRIPRIPPLHIPRCRFIL